MLYFMLLEFFSFLPGRALLFPYFGIVSLVLTIPIQLGIGTDFYKGMWSALRMKTFNMDSLIAIGTSVAFTYSVVNFLSYVWRTGSIVGLNGEKISRQELAHYFLRLDLDKQKKKYLELLLANE